MDRLDEFMIVMSRPWRKFLFNSNTYVRCWHLHWIRCFPISRYSLRRMRGSFFGEFVIRHARAFIPQLGKWAAAFVSSKASLLTIQRSDHQIHNVVIFLPLIPGKLNTAHSNSFFRKFQENNICLLCLEFPSERKNSHSSLVS
jgi:hypothetical protein